MGQSLRDRLLKLVCEQSESLASAWDVPRTASLPGLSERLGVVRSALHGHIKILQKEGFIITRQAHVIGGGSRKRTVIHPTTEVRRKASTFIEEENESIGRLIGNPPPLVEIVGREELMTSISNKIIDSESLILTGLPGIGKTAFVRSLADLMIHQGKTIRWMRFDSDSDVSFVGRSLIGDDSPTTSEAILGMLPLEDIIILDEIQEVHPRHLSKVIELCSSLLKRGNCILISRAPVPAGIDGDSIRIEGLSPHSARMILGDRVDDEMGLEIASALGGHPLVLGLWSPEDPLPTASDAVMSFVQETVLDHLDSEEVKTFDELAISPIPIGIDEISSSDRVGDLDDRALIRWHSARMEGQHLIENVRKESWSTIHKQDLHSNLANWWSSRKGARARRIELHHRISAQDSEFPSLLLSSLDSIYEEIPAAAAILVEEALQQHPDNSSLRSAAVRIALDRAELDIASDHISKLENSPEKRLFNSQLLRIDGNLQEANEEETLALSEMDDESRLRYGLASIVRKIDDHMPGNWQKGEASLLLEELDQFERKLPVDHELTPPTRTACAISRFRVHLACNSIIEATKVFDRLISIAGPRDPIVRRLRLRLDCINADESEIMLLAARIEAEPDIVERCRLLHSLIDSQSQLSPALIAAFERSRLFPLPEHTTSGRRLMASRWRIIARIDHNNAIHALRESVHLHLISGCRNVADQLLAEAHRLITSDL